MGADFVTQEQLNLKLNQLRYEFGVKIERSIDDALQPFLTRTIELSAQVNAAIESRNREVADIHTTLREIGRDTALAFTGYGIIKDQLTDLKKALDKRDVDLDVQIKTVKNWQDKRSAWERAILGGVKLLLPGTKIIVFTILATIGGGLIGLLWGLISQLWR